MHAEYLPQFQEEAGLVDFCEISPELSRDFRGLRVWLPIKMFGIDVFRQQLDEKLDLARWAADELRRIGGIEIVAEPQLSIVTFRMVKAGADLNALNLELIARINARKRVMLTGTTIDGSFVIRICVVSFRTHRERMEMCMEDIRTAVRELA
jgi:aromatic-L-amino-acid decarboxylase